ncbi:MAG: thiamine pyrophosphate-dependent dehydrogenase E1 component subunit alpha [Eubacteriales bacterium]|nr:thiamine pyrophosphate-dependent dehydrogenase E1 component subunit alpha [Eubacteriales bacterium]
MLAYSNKEGKNMNKEKLLDLYRMMVQIREFENECIELAKSNATRAAVHTYIGEEAIAAGVCAHMSNQDYITSTHRGHGHCIAKGADLEKMFAELLGREGGYCKGKGGSMHIADLATGNLGANGIVGGGIPLAVGAALGIQLDNKKNFVVSFFGDGAANEGSFHEALNMASIWSLPVIFVCENNEYGISTHVSKSTNIQNIAIRAMSYGIKGVVVDGNNILEVYEETRKAVDDVVSGQGPVLLEMKTYRMSGHYFGDNQNYRTKDEVNQWKEKDPILRCEQILQKEYDLTEEDLLTIRKNIRTEVLAASEKAKLQPEPMIEDLTGDLFDQKFADIEWKSFVKAQGKG